MRLSPNPLDPSVQGARPLAAPPGAAPIASLDPAPPIAPDVAAAPPSVLAAVADHFKEATEPLANLSLPLRYLWRTTANATSRGLDRDALLSLGPAGIGPETYEKYQRDQAATGLAESLAAGSADMDDHEFDGLLQSLQTQLAHPPAARPEPELRAPSLGELAVGGIFGLLAPKFAPIALAAPFQNRLREHDFDAQRMHAEDADAYRRWKDQIDGTQTQISLVERRQARQDGIQARKDLAAQQAQAKADLDKQQAEARAELERQRLAGRVSLANLSSAARTELARIAHGDRETAAAAKLVAGAAPESRAALAESFRRSHTGIFSTLDDDAIAAIGAETPKEILTGAQTDLTKAKTATENATRQGKVNNLIKQGRYIDARTEAVKADRELDEVRARYLPRQLQAQFAKVNADAEKARKSANDMYAGINGRGRASADAWTRLDLKLDETEAKTRGKLAGLSPQKQAIERAIAEIDGRLAAAEKDDSMNDVQKNSLRSEQTKLRLSLGKIGAVYAESRSYLERVKKQREEVAAKIQESATREAAAAAASGPVGPIGGNAPSPAKVALPSGWSISRSK